MDKFFVRKMKNIDDEKVTLGISYDERSFDGATCRLSDYFTKKNTIRKERIDRNFREHSLIIIVLS